MFCIAANAQFSDDFADGDFTSNPAWNGDVNKFIVSNYVLQLNDLNASGSSIKAYLSTPSQAIINAEWSCKVVVNTTLTSGNYVRFYLTADTANLTVSLKGYFVMIGNTTKDISLCKQNGAASTFTRIIDGADNLLNTGSNEVIVKVTRDETGKWQLFYKLPSDIDFVLVGEIIDNQIFNAKYSGIYVTYSSTNFNKYFFDDFNVVGEPYIFVPQKIKRHSIVINEIMADPDPPVALPNAEYIELYNRTSEEIDLAGWKIKSGNSIGTITQGKIAANGYLLLCSSTNKPNFDAYGTVAQVTSFPTLANSGALIVLMNADNQVVTWTEYSDTWFGADNFRKDGGFSLERIDADNLHCSSANWQPSQSQSGGTPCAVNSVKRENKDEILPEFLGINFLNNNSVELIFNKEMNDSLLQVVQNYFSDDVDVQTAVGVEPKMDRVDLTFSPDLANDTVEIKVQNLKCISGFPLADFSFQVASPQDIEPNDLVINEVLYNPQANTGEFVELFNKSDKVVKISDIFLTRRYNGELDTKKTITTDNILLFPKKYLLLTDNLPSICNFYTCDENALKIQCSLPSLPNTDGSVVICKSDATIIDEFTYSDKMQSPSIANSQGVSLERINPYLPTNDASNWHSASFSENYGTPSRQNSQYNVQNTTSAKPFWLDYETFTPDNDGYRDVLNLNYKFSENGYQISASIYTPSGLKVRTLCNNRTAGLEGIIIWDGLRDNSTLCGVGIYVIVIEAINVNTTNKTAKKLSDKIVCVLSMK